MLYSSGTTRRAYRDSPIQIAEQEIKAHCMLSGGIGYGVEGGDVAAYALQTVPGKDWDRLWMAFHHLQHQSIGRDRCGGNLRVIHHSLRHLVGSVN